MILTGSGILTAAASKLAEPSAPSPRSINARMVSEVSLGVTGPILVPENGDVLNVSPNGHPIAVGEHPIKCRSSNLAAPVHKLKLAVDVNVLDDIAPRTTSSISGWLKIMLS